MANEIQLAVKFAASKVGVTASVNPSKSRSMTGDTILLTAQDATSSAADLSLGTLTSTTAQLLCVISASTNTQNVQIGVRSGGSDYWMQEIPVGEAALFEPVDGVTLRVKSTSGTQRVSIYAAQA